MTTTATRPRRPIGWVPDTQPRQSDETPERLRCECSHAEGLYGPITCQEPATRRVTAVCQAEGCQDPAEIYVLCAPCADHWVLSSAQSAPALELRVEPL